MRLVYLMDQPCDMLIQCIDGSWHVLEVKNREHGHRKRLTKAQKVFWKTAEPAPPLVTSPSEALAALGLVRVGDVSPCPESDDKRGPG